MEFTSLSLGQLFTDQFYDFGVTTSSSETFNFSSLNSAQASQLNSSSGIDVIVLLGGDDIAIDDSGSRIYFGNAGRDIIDGAGGNDTIASGQGNDSISGGTGDDVLAGNLDNDTISGGSGSDTVLGGRGDDLISGGSSNDNLSGDRGDDTIAGGAGFDILTGGSGRDHFVLEPGSGVDTITDFITGTDILRLPDGVSTSNISLEQSGGNTEIWANGETLAIIRGVAPSRLSTTDFVESQFTGTGTQTSESLFFAMSDGRVGRVDDSGTFVGRDVGRTLTDIAADSSGELWGISFSALYRVNLNNSRAEFVGNLGLGVDMNSLDFDGQGRLIATDATGTIYQLSTVTGAASQIGTIADPSFDSSGDVVFDATQNAFYATSEPTSFGGSDVLYKFDLQGNSERIGAMGFGRVYGLSMRQGQLYGYTSDGLEIAVDQNSGASTIVRSISTDFAEIYGSASYNNAASLGSIEIGSPGAGSSIEIGSPGAGGSIEIGSPGVNIDYSNYQYDEDDYLSTLYRDTENNAVTRINHNYKNFSHTAFDSDGDATEGDISGDANKVYALASGVVTEAHNGIIDNNKDWRNNGAISIYNPVLDQTFIYFHLKEKSIDESIEGLYIESGTLLGIEGDTGFSNGAHTHVEVQSGRINLDLDNENTGYDLSKSVNVIEAFEGAVRGGQIKLFKS